MQLVPQISKLAGGDKSVIKGQEAMAAGASAALATKSSIIIPGIVRLRSLLVMLHGFGVLESIPAYYPVTKRLTQKEFNRLKPFVID